MVSLVQINIANLKREKRCSCPARVGGLEKSKLKGFGRTSHGTLHIAARRAAGDCEMAIEQPRLQLLHFDLLLLPIPSHFSVTPRPDQIMRDEFEVKEADTVCRLVHAVYPSKADFSRSPNPPQKLSQWRG